MDHNYLRQYLSTRSKSDYEFIKKQIVTKCQWSRQTLYNKLNGKTSISPAEKFVINQIIDECNP